MDNVNPLYTWVIDSERNTRRPEQAYFCKTQNEYQYDTGMVLPFSYHKLARVIRHFPSILQDSIHHGITLDSAYTACLERITKITPEMDLFNKHQNSSLIVSTRVNFGNTDPTEPLQRIKTEFCAHHFCDNDIERMFEENSPSILSMANFAESYQDVKNTFYANRTLPLQTEEIVASLKNIADIKYKIFMDDFFNSEQTALFEKNNGLAVHNIHKAVFPEGPPQTSHLFTRKTPRPSDPWATGDKIRRAITSASSIAATLYAEKFDVPVLYNHSESGVVTTVPLEGEATVRFSAPYRSFLKAVNAVQIASHLMTGKPELDTAFLNRTIQQLNTHIMAQNISLSSPRC